MPSALPAAATARHSCGGARRNGRHARTRLPHELGEDAADAPDIDRGRVVRRAQQHLGRAVPERHDLRARAPPRPQQTLREPSSTLCCGLYPYTAERHLGSTAAGRLCAAASEQISRDKQASCVVMRCTLYGREAQNSRAGRRGCGVGDAAAAAAAAARLVRVALDGDAERAAQAQVCDLQALGRVVDQQVLRLQVAVHHTVLVAVRDALDQLVHEALRARARRRAPSACHGLRRALGRQPSLRQHIW